MVLHPNYYKNRRVVRSIAPTQPGGRNRGEIEAIGAASYSIISIWHITVLLDPDDVEHAIVVDLSICRCGESYDIATIVGISTRYLSIRSFFVKCQEEDAPLHAGG